MLFRQSPGTSHLISPENKPQISMAEARPSVPSARGVWVGGVQDSRIGSVGQGSRVVYVVFYT